MSYFWTFNTMVHTMWSLLFWCLSFIVHDCVSNTIDISAEATNLLMIRGIKQPTVNEKILAKEVVYERKRAAKNEYDKDAVKYGLLLATCNRVDTLEEYFCAGTKLVLPKSMARVERWEKISELKTPLVLAFLDSLRKKGVKDAQFPLIWNIISELCQDTNQRAAHLYIPLPDANEKSILSALKIMGIIADGPVVTIYKLLMEPLPSPFKEELEKIEKVDE